MKGVRFPVERMLELPDSVPLTTAEVAAVTTLAPSTLHKWSCWGRERDLLPHVKRAGRNLYRPSDVRRWLGMGREGA